MTWLDPGHPAAALLGLLVAAVAGWWCPALIAHIPEPEPEPDDADPLDADPADPDPADVGPADPDRSGQARDERRTLPPPPPKEPYADIAALPGLAWRTALASGLAGAVLAASVGWSWSLLFLLPLAPVGVALALVDWRTTLLPTRVIAPTYAVTVALILVAALADRSREDLVHAAIGWAVMGGVFFVLWFIYPRGLGYGDVRLSGVLGMALGYLGWSELATGIYGAFLIGGLGGALLSALRITDRKRFPFGPFMLVAALVAVAIGPWVTDRLGY
jgi:leader peptidase (prepilin peptidase)/N-methyltransferase